MTLEELNLICWIWIGIAVGSFILLQFVSAPYGRHVRKGWGPQISNKLGWVLMEFPSLFIIVYFFLTSEQGRYASLLSLLWVLHYLNRTFLYPLRIRTKGKKMPVAIVASAVFFNCVNAGLNGYYLAHFEHYDRESFLGWNFVLGIFLFAVGFFMNQKSDHMLIRLRKPGDTGYKIPKGFLFDLISCPNLFGELVQWFGFALMACNLPAFTFFVWTFANLVPRAVRHHKWYREHFQNYPRNRKAIIPKIL